MPKIQIKIVGALAALVVLVVALSGIFIEQRLHARIVDDIIADLGVRTQVLASMARRVEFHATPTAVLEEFARDAAEAVEARVTLIAPDGVVLADSALSFNEVIAVERHHNRPEVIEALAGGFGHSIRRSDTLKRPHVYVALPLETMLDEEGRRVVVRLAVDLHELDAAIQDLRLDLLSATLLGLIAALGLSVLLARFTLRPIEELRSAVADIAEGNLDRRLHWEGTLDERTEIAAAVNRMARQLRDRVDQATHERDQLEGVLSAMTEGVLVLDTEQRVLLANPRLREMFDVWGEVGGRLAAEVVPSFDVKQALGAALTGNDVVVSEVEILVPRERTVVVHATRFPKEGERQGTVAVLHDVTELRRVDRVRSDFIANASHELRTPLTAIRGFADMLTHSELSEDELRSYLEVIGRNTQRMSDLVDDLLQLSRIESGKAPLDEAEFDVLKLCRVILSDLEPRLHEADLEVSLHCDVDEMRAFTDRQAFEQVVTNLLTNAVRYTNAGGRIDVSLRSDDDSVEFEVRDTGIGIPEAALDRIFERFYRVDAARSRVIGSTGLGLSIVKHLLRLLGGSVSVKSRVGEGSTFTVRLPRARRSDAMRVRMQPVESRGG